MQQKDGVGRKEYGKPGKQIVTRIGKGRTKRNRRRGKEDVDINGRQLDEIKKVKKRGVEREEKNVRSLEKK